MDKKLKSQYKLEKKHGELCTCFHFSKDHLKGKKCMKPNCGCKTYYSQNDSMEH